MKKIFLSIILVFGLCSNAHAMKQLWLGGGDNGNLSNSVTNYGGVMAYDRQVGTTENVQNQIVAYPGTLSNLNVRLSANSGGSTKSYLFTIRKNGVDTGLTCTVLGSSATTCSDTADTVSVSQGDLLSISSVPTNTPTAVSFRFSVVFDSLNSSSISDYSFVTSTALNNASARFVALNGAGGTGFSSTEATVQQVIPISGKISYLTALLVTAPGASKSFTVTLRKNGADTAQTCLISGATQTFCTDNVHPITVAAGDIMDISITPSSTPTTSSPVVGVAFISDTERKFLLLANSGSTTASGTTANFNTISSVNGPWTSSNNDVTRTTLTTANTLVITDLYAHAFTAPDNGAGTQSYAIALAAGGSDTAVTCSLSESTQNCSFSGSYSPDITGATQLNYHSTPTSTPTASAFAISAAGTFSYTSGTIIRQCTLKQVTVTGY